MSAYRLDPSRIKVAGNEPPKKGGQALVVVGTLIPPEEVPTWMPENFLTRLLEVKLAIKKFDWNHENSDESAKFLNV